MKKRISNAFGRIIQKVFGRYLAAFMQWGERSIILSATQDARDEVNFGVRSELQRRHEHWVQNSELVQRIRNLKIQFGVGVGGLQCVPNAGDSDWGDPEALENWNDARAVRWADWCRQPEVSSLMSMGQLHVLWEGSLFDYGEFFVQKCKVNGRPMVNTIAVHRVQTDPAITDPEKKMIFDGIQYDANFRPIKYFVRREMEKDKYDEVPAEFIIHKFKCRRPGMLRGIPEGFSGMNRLHDYEDLHRYEMQAAKIASRIALVKSNPSGEVDTQQSRRLALGIGTTNAKNQPVMKNGDTMYDISLGSVETTIRSGDKLDNFMITRPAATQQQYWDLLVSMICNGYNVPKLLVMPYSMQGTVTRADLDVCTNAFRSDFEIVAEAVREIYEWQVGWDVKFNQKNVGESYPSDFKNVVIRPPRAPNVDIGYTAQALETEMRLGVKPVQDVYAERNQDWRVQWRQNAEAAAFKKKLAKEFDIEPDEISQVIEPQLDAQPTEPESQTA